jgi:hypothetical protein
VAHVTAIDPVLEIGCGQQAARRADDGTELHRREQRFPQRNFVAEHEQDAVASPHTALAEEVGELIRACRHLRKRPHALSSALIDEMQCGLVVPGRDCVEVVERPVEVVERRPSELPNRRVAVEAVAEQEVARRQKRFARLCQCSSFHAITEYKLR